MSMVIVFGSLNIDLMMEVEHQPQIGETVLTPTYKWLPGGKGANQALACSRSGIKTAMVGQIGDDGFGTRIYNTLKRDEVWVSSVGRHDSEPTGMAFITTDKTGDNQIVVATGANNATSGDQIPDEILGPDNVILMQMEIPHAENWDVIRRAKAKGAQTILNLAPAGAIPKDVLVDLDYLIVNQIEGRQIAEKMGLTIEDDAIKLAKTLAENADLTCVMTMGHLGAVVMKSNGTGWKVGAVNLGEDVVDTTGAGDTFCGVFAGCVFEKRSIQDSMRRASIAGSLACKSFGAQTAMPRSDEIDDALGLVDLATPIQ
ncbi:MAG: ribokinase [Alphaproteobacteria bacterium]|nr:MAG: ribokinase [Alphaproteobacteria bacterium]